ncbi:hypothetical protein [Desulfocurvibacter africanus]|uniref:hypothetical protein n=1 Tax=Desulfocurvibacter africanus TaxID=873 RepID=UPI0003F66477|nr:hypothetical protein [Desulfocurvibacter africanus]
MSLLPDLNIRFLTNYIKCNYSCPYCIVGSMKGDPRYDVFNENALSRIATHITQIESRINIRLGVLGEFFLSSALVGVAEQLSHAPNIKTLNLITNLSFPFKKYSDDLKNFDQSKLGLVASLHPTEIKDFEAWFDTARRLNELVDFSVALVAYPPLIPTLPTLVSKLGELGIHAFVQGFVGKFNDREYPFSYSAEEQRILRTISTSRHDYAYFVEAKRAGLCNAGHKSVFVDITGQVRPCGMGRGGESLGNFLQSPGLRLYDAPRPCTRKTCFCDTENINTVSFETHYAHTGPNQHKFMYRFAELAAENPEYGEWSIRYP